MLKMLIAATCTVASVVSLAGGQTLIDNFSDGIRMPNWLVTDAANDGIAVAETNQRLEFPFTGGNTPSAVAGFASNSWGILTTTDFKLRIAMKFSPSAPTHLYGALTVNLSLIGKPRLSNGFYEGPYVAFGSYFEGVSYRMVAVGRENANATTTGIALYNAPLGTTLFSNAYTGVPVFTATEETTLFLKYVTATDTLYTSFVGYDDPLAVVVTSLTNGLRKPIQVYLAARAQFPVNQSGANSWMDTVVLDSGLRVNSNTPIVLWRQPTTGEFGFWWVASNGTVASPGQFSPLAPSTGWQPYGIGDFNADGNTDIFWRNNLTGTNYIWYLSGTNLIGGGVPPGVPADGTWVPQVVGDLNGDNYADVVWKHTTDGSYQVWLMKEATIVGGGSIGIPGAAWTLAACGDINKDGRDDLIWRNTNGTNYVWYMNGTTMSGGASLPTLNPALGWTLQGAIDVNRDGEDDLVWRNQASGTTLIWVMNGLGIVSNLVLPVTNPPWLIVGSQ